jgi:hypothetical protein
LKRSRFLLDLTLSFVYGWLLLFALPDSLKAEGLTIIPLLAAVTLHQAHNDFSLSEEYAGDFDRWGRYVLAAAPLTGWVADLWWFQDNVLMSAVCTAVLAGSCLYKTFKEELPQTGHTRFRWFLAGLLLFVLLHALAGEDFLAD